MILFTKLLLAHLIGDFLMQPTRWVIHKESQKIRSKYLYWHTLLHFALVMLLLWDPGFWKMALLIAGLHYLTDLGKLYINPLFRNRSVPFMLDQAAHIVILYIVAFHGNLQEHTRELAALIPWGLLTALVLVTLPAAVLMGKLLEGMGTQIPTDHKSLPNAGKYIGIMERLFVLIFILIDHWEAIGLLITAKSVFRFNDLKESNSRKLTEYILIGTLMSFGIAILTGLIYLYFNPLPA